MPYSPMPSAETTETPVIPLSRQDSHDLGVLARALVEQLADHGPLARRLDHLDEMVHQLGQAVDGGNERAARIETFIDEQRPLLARAVAMLDPGSLVRRAMPGRHRPPRPPRGGTAA